MRFVTFRERCQAVRRISCRGRHAGRTAARSATDLMPQTARDCRTGRFTIGVSRRRVYAPCTTWLGNDLPISRLRKRRPDAGRRFAVLAVISIRKAMAERMRRVMPHAAMHGHRHHAVRMYAANADRALGDGCRPRMPGCRSPHVGGICRRGMTPHRNRITRGTRW